MEGMKKNKSRLLIYGPGCNAVIEALADLRREGIVEPQLVAQEITYIREYYGNDCQRLQVCSIRPGAVSVTAVMTVQSGRSWPVG